MIILFLTKYWRPFTKSSFVIFPSYHHLALFLIHSGIWRVNGGSIVDSPVLVSSVGGTIITPSLIRNWIPSTNVSSSIWSLAHQLAISFIQSGIIIGGLSFWVANFLETLIVVVSLRFPYFAYRLDGKGAPYPLPPGLSSHHPGWSFPWCGR